MLIAGEPAATADPLEAQHVIPNLRYHETRILQGLVHGFPAFPPLARMR
jgi:hypothetical protein